MAFVDIVLESESFLLAFRTGSANTKHDRVGQPRQNIDDKALDSRHLSTAFGGDAVVWNHRNNLHSPLNQSTDAGGYVEIVVFENFDQLSLRHFALEFLLHREQHVALFF